MLVKLVKLNIPTEIRLSRKNSVSSYKLTHIFQESVQSPMHCAGKAANPKQILAVDLTLCASVASQKGKVRF